MNQKQWALNASSTVELEEKAPKSVDFLRRMLVQVLSNAQHGHFLLKEKGRVIAEVGDRNDCLQAEVDVLDTRSYARALLGGNAAAGEAFVDGWWTSPDITQVTRFFSRNLEMMDDWDKKVGLIMKPFSYLRLLSRANTTRQAKRNILAHYDLGNDLYQTFLDERMQYSSAIFNKPGESLSQAQINKLTRLCEKLELCDKDHLLEVGSGWGGLAIFAAKNYGCRVTTTTISDEQFNFAKAAIRAEGLEYRIELLNRDYRLLEGQYDKIVSVEMIEAVGRKFLPGFFEKLNCLLKPNGLLMLQAITIADQRFNTYSRNEDFIQKHVFPGGFLPSMSLMSELVSTKTEFVIRDLRDIGLDYAHTLAHWREKFLEKQEQLHALGYDQKFKNLWLYYLGYCEGGFLERRISAQQLLVSKAPHF
jgi:cyclopropane-fatty-acyl-phospholipid synthase